MNPQKLGATVAILATGFLTACNYALLVTAPLTELSAGLAFVLVAWTLWGTFLLTGMLLVHYRLIDAEEHTEPVDFDEAAGEAEDALEALRRTHGRMEREIRTAAESTRARLKELGLD